MGRKLTPEQQAQYDELQTISKIPWHAISVEECFKRLQCGATGLSSTEVEARRAKYGPNATPPPPKPSIFWKIWEQLTNILIVVLIVSVIIKGVFQDWPDMALILGVIILNVAIGVIQEGKAEAAAEALNNLLAQKATVIRDGNTVTIDAKDVVIGDVVDLQGGVSVPADLRLFRVSNMRAKESALTGESVDVDKSLEVCEENASLGDRKNCAFAGTACTSGAALGIVIALGPTAEIGKIQKMMEDADAGETPLQRQLDVFGYWLSIITIIVAFLSFFLAWKARDIDIPESFAIAVGIAVAIIPEGLPSVVTITLALGVRRMADHKAIIRQLPAVETLGSVSVVCSDKTGTLTYNEMMVTAVRTATKHFTVGGTGYDAYSGEVFEKRGNEQLGSPVRKADAPSYQQLYWLTLPGVVASDGGLTAPHPSLARWPSQRGNPAAGVTPALEDSRWEIAGDPTDVAVLVLGHKVGMGGGEVGITAFRGKFPTIAKIPFDSDYKFIATMQDVETPQGNKRLVFVKGAWDEIIRRCGTQAANGDAFTSEPINTSFWTSEASTFAANGMRVLAVAQMEVPADKTNLTVEEIRDACLSSPALQLNCLLAILDPCRESAARAIEMCHTAGINVKMITGDHADTACYIAKQLGIIDAPTFDRYLRVKDTDPVARKHIVLRGEEIREIPSDPKESELAKYVMDVNVFARVAPEHKLRIVRALKETHGKITSMTGDGVNDAPALKEASIGVAMGITGTDVAKQAAKMILADDLFSTIAEAVRRGRGVYDNLRKVVQFALPTNMAQGCCIIAALVIGIDTPLNAIQVLTVNMVCSVTLGIVIALEEPEATVMQRPPRDPRESLLDRIMVWKVFFATVCLVVTMLGNMQWTVNAPYDGSVEEGRATAMTTLVVSQCVYALNCRFVNRTSITPAVLVGNNWIWVAIVVNIVIQLLLIYVPGVNDVWGMAPLDGVQWGKIIFLSFVVFLAVEIEKLLGPKFLYPVFGPLFRRFDPLLAAIGRFFSLIAGCVAAIGRALICRRGNGAALAAGSEDATAKADQVTIAITTPPPEATKKNALRSGASVD